MASPSPNDMDVATSLLQLNESLHYEKDSAGSKVPRPLPCFCCRQQRKKCDLIRPSCARCLHRGTPCEYPTGRKPYMTKARKRLALEAERRSVSNITKPSAAPKIEEQDASHASLPLSPVSQASISCHHDHDRDRDSVPSHPPDTMPPSPNGNIPPISLDQRLTPQADAIQKVNPDQYSSHEVPVAQWRNVMSVSSLVD
ncbi:hypothetical protein BCR33DRAFT_711771 [Rhizoclosmatium globosum]|uniref:Zn(2)-C6 fungal-type domain-containing protein n=1 Tax=Rhizoclosmatium globosum TaxID=329046 RepID=A0A1Y2CZK8_9FUNG|nr:hypothetical protein BCR33DRAFT_711771 [Rhizoclosmatium globosum]|eukprot:ORY52459.1 hypothetical protein BCR33DRAFT_711771 [Rhizoclosmatium globosum]